MTHKLFSELHRLFGLLDAPATPLKLLSIEGQTRALVLEITRAPDWSLLAPVWQGVQAELGLPAPGIAVSGVDAMQLWFSVREPVPVAQAQAFLQALQKRFMADVEPRRVRRWPQGDAPATFTHTAPVPALQASGNWSAFLAPDLAPVFEDTPWLDIPPGEEGQANLLRLLTPVSPQDWQSAWHSLGLPAAPEAKVTPQTLPSVSANVPTPATTSVPAVFSPTEAATSPSACEDASGAQFADFLGASSGDAATQARHFLLQLMHNEAVPLPLRLEAAKALLQHGG